LFFIRLQARSLTIQNSGTSVSNLGVYCQARNRHWQRQMQPIGVLPAAESCGRPTVLSFRAHRRVRRNSKARVRKLNMCGTRRVSTPVFSPFSSNAFSSNTWFVIPGRVAACLPMATIARAADRGCAATSGNVPTINSYESSLRDCSANRKKVHRVARTGRSQPNPGTILATVAVHGNFRPG